MTQEFLLDLYIRTQFPQHAGVALIFSSAGETSGTPAQEGFDLSE
jgi:hypothetical protein